VKRTVKRLSSHGHNVMLEGVMRRETKGQNQSSAKNEREFCALQNIGRMK